MRCTTLVLDVGGVLVDWSPEYLYAKLIPDARQRAWFLANVCTREWNARQDAGRPLKAATEELVSRFPAYDPLIRAFYDRWDEMLRGCLPAGVALLEWALARSVPVHFLSNWSLETWPTALARFPLLSRAASRLLSGEIACCKPDERIFHEFLRRRSVGADECVFVDDSPENVEAAARIGFHALHARPGVDLVTAVQQFDLGR
jgi:2-haloacid dehalogenase